MEVSLNLGFYKEGKITYFEYDKLFEIEDMLKMEELSNQKIHQLSALEVQ